MILLSPELTYPTQCPACDADNIAGKVCFTGTVTLADATCSACGTTYGQTLPNGQFNRFPVTISADDQYVRVPERGKWLVDLVKRCRIEAQSGLLQGDAISRRHGITLIESEIILLICLDPCYGHALMMLFNAQRHHEQYPNRPIIAIVPAALAWLVPDYVAETWVIEGPRAGLERNIAGFDQFVKQQLTRFDTVWFSHAHIHFGHRATHFSDFTRTPKFDLNQFDQGLVRYVTFILREDRLWLRYSWERLLYRACQRAGLLEKARPLWVRWQARRYQQLVRHLRQRYPQLQISVAGLTKNNSFGFDASIDDLRQRAPLSAEQERSWCALYARSHVVVGVHGSGMLLPTSLAAGFVNLLPPDKLPHYAEDILMAHDNPIHQTLLGRFLPTSVSPRQVAAVISSMLTEFPVWLDEARERGERY